MPQRFDLLGQQGATADSRLFEVHWTQLEASPREKEIRNHSSPEGQSGRWLCSAQLLTLWKNGKPQRLTSCICTIMLDWPLSLATSETLGGGELKMRASVSRKEDLLL